MHYKIDWQMVCLVASSMRRGDRAFSGYELSVDKALYWVRDTQP